MIILFVPSLIGLVASTLVHLCTFVGINPQSFTPSVWSLHILLFPVWLALILSSLMFAGEAPRKELLQRLTRNSPRWMKALTLALVPYVAFNSLYTPWCLSEGGVPSIEHGKKVIASHGKIRRELTDTEYEQQEAYEVRFFSGAWMMCYAVATIISYSLLREDRLGDKETSSAVQSN